MLKSIGRFLTFLSEKSLAALSARRSLSARRILPPVSWAAAAMGRLASARGRQSPPVALTFPVSNDSFIQLFELQALKFALHRSHDMASDHTRTSILSAAERLYADRGFGDVTLRDIVAAAGVNLAAVNYHFGSKDELIAELFVTRSLATNRERLNELKAAEEAGGGRTDIDAILRALVGPTLRGCLGPDREGSTAARFMIRASIESVPPIRRIKNREIDHLRKFAAAMRRSLPDCSEVEL